MLAGMEAARKDEFMWPVVRGAELTMECDVWIVFFVHSLSCSGSFVNYKKCGDMF